MLREAEFAYAPNEALPQPRHPMFELQTAAAPADVHETELENDNASTPTSVTGQADANFSAKLAWYLHTNAYPLHACVLLTAHGMSSYWALHLCYFLHCAHCFCHLLHHRCQGA